MSFKVNHDEASSGSIVPGTYEVLIKSAAITHTKKGLECIDMPLVVRNDIEQKYKNAYHWHKMFRGKTSGQYHNGILQAMAKACNFENGKEYDSLNEFLADFQGKPVRITIKQNGEYLNVTNWEATNYPQVIHIWKKEDGNVSGGLGQEVNPGFAEELPF